VELCADTHTLTAIRRALWRQQRNLAIKNFGANPQRTVPRLPQLERIIRPTRRNDGRRGCVRVPQTVCRPYGVPGLHTHKWRSTTTADDAVESQASRLPLAAMPQRRSQTTLLSTDCPPCNDDIPLMTIPTAGGLLALQAYIALCYALSDALQQPGLVSAAQRRGCTGDLVCLNVIDEGGVANAVHERHPLEAVSCLRRVLQTLQAVSRGVRSCRASEKHDLMPAAVKHAI
jgi:hypothetical protein